MSRSIGQQIAHWARIGRELEQRSDLSVQRIAEVLTGRASYDSLSAEEQALTRAHWQERMDELRTNLRFDRDFARRGRSYVELDESGSVVRREPAAAGGATG
jgi:hypothetical protein